MFAYVGMYIRIRGGGNFFKLLNGYNTQNVKSEFQSTRNIVIYFS